MVFIVSWMAVWAATDVAMAKFGLLPTLQLLERAALPSLFLAWVVSPTEPFPPGTQFNTKIFGLSFSWKNHSSFGLRFPCTKKMFKNG